MARPFHVLSRLCAPHFAAPLSFSGLRCTSRGVSKAWTGFNNDHRDRSSQRASRFNQQLSDEDFGLEDVEDKLQALEDEGRKRQRTVKYHILRRKMTPPGAPQRKLTWDAIEQIRYLKQEQPEEWTVERLAEGFSVSPDVILRILRSKFVPPPGRRAKQDAKVMVELSQQVLSSGAGAGSDRRKLPGNCAQAVLTSGGGEDAVVPATMQTLMIRGVGREPSGLVPATSLSTESGDGFSKDDAAPTSGTNPAEEDEEDEESWDGQVFTEEELELYMKMEKSPVVQVGSDFFDIEGNFLYRI